MLRLPLRGEAPTQWAPLAFTCANLHLVESRVPAGACESARVCRQLRFEQIPRQVQIPTWLPCQADSGSKPTEVCSKGGVQAQHGC